MKKSRYFSDLMRSYNDEIDDLITDSAGASVLQKRLNEKRREMKAILPMIEFSPEMVAVVFYDAFEFLSPETMQQIVLSDPAETGFITWDELKDELSFASWAEPLIDASLKADGGDVFLVATAALEFLRTRSSSKVPMEEAADEEESGDDAEDGDGADDLSEAGADWLSEQGFETLDR